MSEYDQQRTSFIDRLRTDMPPTADEATLQRVRMQARAASPAAIEAPVWQRSWLMIGGLTAAAAVVALALAVAPGQQTAAFARDRAVAALLFQSPGKVLHVEAVYSETRTGEGSAASEDLDQRWSIWADAGGARIREEFADRTDGSLEELRVRSGDTLTAFIADEGGTPRLLEQDMSNQPAATVLDDMVGYMRARIADGSAKVTGTIETGGTKYWIVEWESDEGDIAVTVTMRTSDYRIRTWKQTVTDTRRPGGTQEERVTFRTIEQLDPASLPDGFFSRQAVVEAAERAPRESR